MSGIATIAVYDCTVNPVDCRSRSITVFPTVVMYLDALEQGRFVVKDGRVSVTDLVKPMLRDLVTVLEVDTLNELFDVTSQQTVGIGHVLIARFPSSKASDGASSGMDTESELKKLRELFDPLATFVTVNCVTAVGQLCQQLGINESSVWLYSQPALTPDEKPRRIAVAADVVHTARALHGALVKLLPSPPAVETWILSAVSAEGDYRLRREGQLVFFFGAKSDVKSKILERIAREMHASSRLWNADDSIGIGVVHCRSKEAPCDSVDLGTFALPEVRL